MVVRLRMTPEEVQAAVPSAALVGSALVVAMAAALTGEPRVALGYGVPVAACQFLWPAAAAAAGSGALLILAAATAAHSDVAFTVPVYLLAAWGATFLVRRVFSQEVIRLSLAEEEQREAAGDLAKTLEKERIRIAGSRQRIEKIFMLTNVANDLSSTLNLREVVEHTLGRTRELTGQQGEAQLLLFDDAGARAFRMSETGLTIAREEPDPLSHWVRDRLMPLYVSDLPRDLRFRTQAGELGGVRSLIATPLTRDRAIMGVLEVRAAAPEAFAPEDWRLLTLLGDLSSVALQNSLLYQRTQEEAITDGLTEVFVHRYFQERLAEEINRTVETNGHLALVMADIDNFKACNDQFGHLTGDAVLKRIARVFREGVRGTDLVARYGGEEFAILLVETPRDAALAVAERLRASVEALDLADVGMDRAVTISLGLASLPGPATDARALVERADEALYAAKRGGKNRVVGA